MLETLTPSPLPLAGEGSRRFISIEQGVTMNATATPSSSGVESIRLKTLANLNELAGKAQAFQLPQPPEALDGLKQKLAANQYEVLVVGEAKRGKSSFINALIGRDILPTDVDIATSQVFRISRAEREGYRLRFEDDSARAITLEDFPKYGSQVVADLEGQPRLDQWIRWIEVEVPALFLPEGVHLLDTPGMGSLYAAHTQITQRFVPLADAVVYVLDSTQPIGQPDLDFIEAILNATPHLLFIQTKIDILRRDEWQQLQQRNQQILQERFGDRLADQRVWPISSTHLMKAASTGDEDYLMVSRHQEFAPVLRDFLFRAAGWYRAVDAVVVAGRYHGTAQEVLKNRLKSLNEESQQRRTALQERALQRKQQFDAEWGERGVRSRELLDNLRKVAELGKQSLLQALQPGGEIERPLREKIDHLQSVDQAQELGQTLADSVKGAAVAKWQSICQQSTRRCGQLLAPFLEATEALQVEEKSGGMIEVGRDFEMKTKADVYERLKGAYWEGVTSTTITGIGAGVLTTVVTLSWVPPVAIVAAIGTVIWRMVTGWKKAKETQLNAARAELQKYLATVLQDIRQQFLNVDLATLHKSLVDEYFERLVQAMSAQVQKLAAQKSQEAKAEYERLVAQAKLSDEQRTTKGRQLQQQIAEWDRLGKTIQGLLSELLTPPRQPAAAGA